MTNTQATVKVKSGDDWAIHTVIVTSVDTNVSIDGSVSNNQVDGIPSAWFGNWKYINDEGKSQYYTLTSWQFLYNEMPDLPAGFLDFLKSAAQKFGNLKMFLRSKNDAFFKIFRRFPKIFRKIHQKFFAKGASIRLPKFYDTIIW
jgi:hypothetical protein